MAWGMTYGAVGQSSYQAFGQQFAGYPYQSYSVYLVLGRRSEHPTDAQVSEVTVASGASLTATVRAVVVSGPAGAGRTDVAAYSPAGYNPVYGAWVITAASRGASFQLDPGAGSLLNPVFRIQNWSSSSAPSRVQLAGRISRPTWITSRRSTPRDTSSGSR
jgi:hypothetical protein